MTWKCFPHYWPSVRVRHHWLHSPWPIMLSFDLFLLLVWISVVCQWFKMSWRSWDTSVKIIDTMFATEYRTRIFPQHVVMHIKERLMELCENHAIKLQFEDDGEGSSIHNDVIKWKHFPRYWPFVRGTQRSPVYSRHKGQWRRALMFSLICAWINSWVNNRKAGHLKRHRAHYDAIVMVSWIC